MRRHEPLPNDSDYLRLTRPHVAAEGLRELMTKHIQALVDAHNADMAARIAFASRKERDRAIACWEKSKLDYHALEELTDAEFLEAYNKTLLALADLLLPDSLAIA